MDPDLIKRFLPKAIWPPAIYGVVKDLELRDELTYTYINEKDQRFPVLKEKHLQRIRKLKR